MIMNALWPIPAADLIIDAIQGSRQATYTKEDETNLAGENATVPAYITLSIEKGEGKGVYVGGYNCLVDLSHDGIGWELLGVEYRSEYGGDADDFDIQALEDAAPDGTLVDSMRRSVLKLVRAQYQDLADLATEKTERRLER